MTEARGLPERAHSPSTLILALNVLLFVAMLLGAGREELSSFSAPTLMRYGADYGPLVRGGQVQRLVTAMFLHVSPWHLLMNSTALLVIGPRLEAEMGRWRFVVVYFVSGLLGSIVSVLVTLESPVVSAGASGALCGAIAAAAVRAGFNRDRAQFGSMMLWLGLTLIFGALIDADNAAHLGGMLGGAALGLVWRRAAAPARLSTLPGALALGLAVVAFAFQVRARDRSQTAAQLTNEGVDRARNGDATGAIELYRKSLALEPNNPIAHYDLGLALSQTGDLDAAVEHHRRAFALDPSPAHTRGLSGALVNQGSRRMKRREYAAAIACYREAIALDEGEWRAHYNLGLALSATGDKAGAHAAYEAAYGIEKADFILHAMLDSKPELSAEVLDPLDQAADDDEVGDAGDGADADLP